MSVEPETAPPVRRSLFRQHDFRQLFVAKATSSIGTQVTALAMPVLAVQVLHADEFEMGLLGTFEFLAFLVIGLPAGAWVDRWRRKRVLVTNDLIRAVVLACAVAFSRVAFAGWGGVLCCICAVPDLSVFFNVGAATGAAGAGPCVVPGLGKSWPASDDWRGVFSSACLALRFANSCCVACVS